MTRFKCSECSKEINLYSTSNYSYRVRITKRNKSQFPIDSVIGSSSYQCSYTCNDHALLRTQINTSYLIYENILRYVEKSESAIRAKGNEVRFPIDTSKIKKKD